MTMRVGEFLRHGRAYFYIPPTRSASAANAAFGEIDLPALGEVV